MLAILFDLDGVLIDSAPDISGAVNATLINFGYKPLNIPRITTFIGNGVRTLLMRSLNETCGRDPEYGILAYSDNWHHNTTDTEAFNTILPSNVDFQEIVDWYRNYYTTHAVVNTVLYPGVSEMIAHFSDKKIPMAIVSNKPRSIATVILDKLNISKYFAAIVGPEDVEHIKPDPEGLFLALNKINETYNSNYQPSQLFMVGDSAGDIKSGRAFGCKTIAITGGYGNKEKLAAENADFTLKLAKDVVSCCNL